MPLPKSLPNPVAPNNYVYSYLTRTSGPQSASTNDYDLDTDSDTVDSVFAYSNSDHATLIARINIELLDGSIRNDRFAGIAAAALTNGCLFRVVNNNGGLALDFLDGVSIKQSADFAALAGADSVISQAAGDDLMPIRFSLFKAAMNRPLRLPKNHRIEWTNRDDLSSISLFRIMVQGILEKG